MTYALTSEDISSIRKANDSVCFYARIGPGGLVDVSITANRRSRGYDGPRSETSIPLSDGQARIVNYSRSGLSGDGDTSAFDGLKLERVWGIISSPAVDSDWWTVARFLKPGDVVYPQWTIANDNDLRRQAGLTQDEFRLRIERTGRTGKVALSSFLLDVRTQQVPSYRTVFTSGMASWVREEVSITP